MNVQLGKRPGIKKTAGRMDLHIKKIKLTTYRTYVMFVNFYYDEITSLF